MEIWEKILSNCGEDPFFGVQSVCHWNRQYFIAAQGATGVESL